MQRKGTMAYIGICVFMFALTFIIDPDLKVQTLIRFGAKANFQIVDGKLWYLLTPIFLHASLSHLALNCLSIYIFAPSIEAYFGTVKFVLCSLLIGILATLGSFIASNSVALGASGVVYGYFGFYIYLSLASRHFYQTIGREVFTLLIINLIYTFISPGIDIYGHLFGLLGGLIVFFLFGKKRVFPFQKIIAVSLLIGILFLSYNKYDHYKYSENYFGQKINYYQLIGDQDALRMIEKDLYKLR